MWSEIKEGTLKCNHRSSDWASITVHLHPSSPSFVVVIHLVVFGMRAVQTASHQSTFRRTSWNALVQKVNCVQRIASHLRCQRISIVQSVDIIHKLNNIRGGNGETTTNSRQTEGLRQCLQYDDVWVLVDQWNSTPFIRKITVGFVHDNEAPVSRRRCNLLDVTQWDGLTCCVSRTTNEEELGTRIHRF